MTKFLSKLVCEEFKLKKKLEGPLMGVEIEVEADKELVGDPSNFWRVVRDGSLRGYALEYVSSPSTKDQILQGVSSLYSLFKDKTISVNDSMRAGVHVHLNCCDLTIRQLFTLIAAYYSLEEVFMGHMGQERKGNLFCLGLEEAEYCNNCFLVDLNSEGLESNVFQNENFRYSAMNLVSLSKFGTLEFRALRTPTTPQPIKEWVETLHALYTNSLKFEDPAKLLSAMSADGITEVAKELLGEKAERYTSEEGFEEKVYNSIRGIQQWVYLTDWSKK